MYGKWLVIWCSLCLYGVSLVLPAVVIFPKNSDTPYLGFEAFQAGSHCLVDWAPGDRDWWLLTVSWLANPTLWVALVCIALGRWRTGAALGGCALLMALIALTLFGPAVSRMPGYWVWAGSMAVVMVSPLYHVRTGHRRQRLFAEYKCQHRR